MASRLRLRGPAELLSAMPYLMGFHPTDSLVALGLRGSGLHLQLRGDLPADHDAATVLADHYGRLFQRNEIDGALLIGYGPPERAEPFLRTAHAAMTERGIAVIDLLRTHEGRYWSLLCEVPGCCPPEGRAFDPTTSIVAAEATLAGLVALPDRGAVAATLAGPAGPALEAMREAGDRANLRILRLVADRDPTAVRRAAVVAGRIALEAALTRYASGRRLTDDEVAWLQVLLLIVAFRDRAWERLDRDVRRGARLTEAHRRLWTDMVRRCEPSAVAPSATLLSYLSWRTGNGLHASLALDRALEADPGYSGAGLVGEILARGLSPDEVPPIVRSRRRATRRVAVRAASFAHGGPGSRPARGSGAVPGRGPGAAPRSRLCPAGGATALGGEPGALDGAEWVGRPEPDGAERVGRTEPDGAERVGRLGIDAGAAGGEPGPGDGGPVGGPFWGFGAAGHLRAAGPQGDGSEVSDGGEGPERPGPGGARSTR